MSFEEFVRLNSKSVLMPWQRELVEAIDSGRRVTVVRSRRSGAERLYALALAYLDEHQCDLCAQERPCPCGDGQCQCSCGRCLYPLPLPDDGPLP